MSRVEGQWKRSRQASGTLPPEGCGGCALSLAKKEKLVVRSQALRLFLKSVLGGLEPESRWGTISIRSRVSYCGSASRDNGTSIIRYKYP